MSRRVLITGGGGMIGLALTRELLRNGFSVLCFDLAEQIMRRESELEQLRDLGELELRAGTIMDKWSIATAARNVDAVVHLAAMLGVKRTEDNRLLCMDINTSGTENVLNACVQNRIGHVVLASSSEVYGEPQQNPVGEDAETQGKTVYAVSKLAAEELVKGYHQLTPWLDYTIVRFFNTYGEGQVAQFVLSRFVKLVLGGENPVVYGDGTQRRSFCHVEDAVTGIRAILSTPKARNRVYNIGNSREVFSLCDVAQKVIEVLAPDKNLGVDVIGFTGSDRLPEREIFTRFCNTSRAEEELGFAPKITLEEGIRRLAGAESLHEDWAHRFHN